MAQARVGMPSVGGVKDSAVDFGIGLGGGLVYALSAALFGSGFLGGLIGAGIAGATIKGVRGTAIATILGFQSIIGAFSGSPAQASTADEETM